MTSMNEKRLLTGALVLGASFAGAALYHPHVEFTGHIDRMRIADNKYIMAVVLHSAAGRTANFDVSRLHLRTDNTSYTAETELRATSDESLLRTLWLRLPHPANVFEDTDYMAKTFQPVLRP